MVLDHRCGVGGKLEYLVMWQQQSDDPQGSGDARSQTLTGAPIVSDDSRDGCGGLGGGSGYRYYLEGAEAFLHSGSGTFFHDVKGGRLLYAPLYGAQPGATVAAKPAELVRGDAVDDVSVESLTFEHAAADFTPCFALASACETQSAADEIVAALHWSNSQRVTVRNITVRHTGGYGMWFAHGCHDSSASFVQMSDLGAGGVRIGSQTGDAHNISLTDSTLQDGGHVWRQGCGVLMQAANGSTVSHNTVRGFSYTGISVGWSWGFGKTGNANSVISSNYISTIGQGELSDMCVALRACHSIIRISIGWVGCVITMLWLALPCRPLVCGKPYFDLPVLLWRNGC